MEDLIPNSTLVGVRGPYACEGQVCDSGKNFMGVYYDVSSISSVLFPRGEIQRWFADDVYVCDDQD